MALQAASSHEDRGSVEWGRLQPARDFSRARGKGDRDGLAPFIRVFNKWPGRAQRRVTP